MPEEPERPGRKQALFSLIISAIAFLYLMLVPLYITSFFTLALAAASLIFAILAKRRGFTGPIRTFGLLLSVLDLIVSALLIIIPIMAVNSVQG